MRTAKDISTFNARTASSYHIPSSRFEFIGYFGASTTGKAHSRDNAHLGDVVKVVEHVMREEFRDKATIHADEMYDGPSYKGRIVAANDSAAYSIVDLTLNPPDQSQGAPSFLEISAIFSLGSRYVESSKRAVNGLWYLLKEIQGGSVDANVATESKGNGCALLYNNNTLTATGRLAVANLGLGLEIHKGLE